LPQVNPATLALLVVALLGAAWAAGLLRAHYEEGQATLRVTRAGRVLVTVTVRDTWLLLALSLLMGWAVAAAVERSAWVPGFDTEGRLVPALALTSALGWLFICAGLRRFAYTIASLLAALVSLALFTPSPLTSASLSVPALRQWLVALPGQTNLMLLMGLIVLFALAGVWTSWWIFRRHHGLVALLPSGTILAVEIINDTSPGLGFFVVVWWLPRRPFFFASITSPSRKTGGHDGCRTRLIPVGLSARSGRKRRWRSWLSPSSSCRRSAARISAAR